LGYKRPRLFQAAASGQRADDHDDYGGFDIESLSGLVGLAILIALGLVLRRQRAEAATQPSPEHTPKDARRSWLIFWVVFVGTIAVLGLALVVWRPSTTSPAFVALGLAALVGLVVTSWRPRR
jgi:hypothetical protein